MNDVDIMRALNDRLDQNMSDFDAELIGMSDKEIAEISEVSATREIYTFIKTDGDFDRRQAELLLRMDNPLKFIVDNWPCFDLAALAEKALEGSSKETDKKLSPKLPQPERDAPTVKKPSILERIKANRQSAHRKSAPKALNGVEKQKNRECER